MVESNDSVPSDLAAAIDLSLQTEKDQPGSESVLPTTDDAGALLPPGSEFPYSHLQEQDPSHSVDNSSSTSTHNDGDFTIAEGNVNEDGDIIPSTFIPPTSSPEVQPTSHSQPRHAADAERRIVAPRTFEELAEARDARAHWFGVGLAGPKPAKR